MQLLDLQGCKLGLGGKGFYPAVMHLSVASLIEKTISITPETAWCILTVYSFSVNSTHIKNCLLLYVPEASHHFSLKWVWLPIIVCSLVFNCTITSFVWNKCTMWHLTLLVVFHDPKKFPEKFSLQNFTPQWSVYTKSLSHNNYVMPLHYATYNNVQQRTTTNKWYLKWFIKIKRNISLQDLQAQMSKN